MASTNAKMGLVFPVGRVRRRLRGNAVGMRIGGTAAPYMTAVLEYVTAELLLLAGQAARDNKRKRIQPAHIRSVALKDPELHELIGATTILPLEGQPSTSKRVRSKKAALKRRRSEGSLPITKPPVKSASEPSHPKPGAAVTPAPRKVATTQIARRVFPDLPVKRLALIDKVRTLLPSVSCTH